MEQISARSEESKTMVLEGMIGRTELVQFSLGFTVPKGNDNRYYNPKLGGGAAKDIAVYAYHLTEHTLADHMASFVSRMEERMGQGAK